MNNLKDDANQFRTDLRSEFNSGLAKTREEIKAEEAALKADFKKVSGIAHQKSFVAALVLAGAGFATALYFIFF